VVTSQTTAIKVTSLSIVRPIENLFLTRQFPGLLPSAVVGQQPLCVTEDVTDMPLKVHASPAPLTEEDISYAKADEKNVEPEGASDGLQVSGH